MHKEGKASPGTQISLIRMQRVEEKDRIPDRKLTRYSDIIDFFDTIEGEGARL